MNQFESQLFEALDRHEQRLKGEQMDMHQIRQWEEVAAIKENKERTMTRKYTIENDQNSVISTHDTYEDAIVAAEAYVGPDGVVGHDGDLSEHGDRTLVWGSEESADNDDGENAIAVIRRV